MSEQAIVTAKANVMVYDDQAKKWNPSGSSPGISKVQIFQHLLNQSYRVVGRKLQDHEVVINCLLAKGLKYNQANQTFLQWRDSKQVYGLHFQSKEEADVFAQTLKLAVDNLNRLAAVTAVNNSNSINGNVNVGSGSSGDNISLGKRSTTSSDYNQSIYDENDRPYNMNPNAMMNHHQNSSSNLYATQGVGQLAQMRQLQQQQQQQQQQQAQAPNLVTATALSTSTSSCSSTSSTGSGLTISINNQNGHNSSSNLNGHNYNRQTSGVNEYNFNANGAPALTNLNPYNIHQQQQASIHNQPVAAPPPMYQSSPIQQQPPVPPPIPPQLFATNNNNNIDQYSAQKIYDVIPDTGNYPSSGPSNVMPVAQPPAPPPLPVGLFSGLNNNNGPSAVGGPVPPPPPPPPPLSLNGHNGTNGSNSSNSLMNEIARAQGGKTLKKVEDNSRDTIRAAPMDFLAEIKQKFEKKNQQQQQQNGSNENHSPTDSSGSSSSHNGLGQQRKSSVQLNKPNGQMSNGHFESPKAIKKITSTPNVVNNCTNNSSNGNCSSSYTNGVHVNGNGTSSDPYSTSINMEKLKQELVIEFRKELQSFKSDIINAILNELRR